MIRKFELENKEAIKKKERKEKEQNKTHQNLVSRKDIVLDA